LKGQLAKNSALIEIENKLMLAQEMAYKHLTNASRRRSFCRSASELGEIMGKHLNIHPAINKSSKERPLKQNQEVRAILVAEFYLKICFI
jgi:hypothetical protein